MFIFSPREGTSTAPVLEPAHAARISSKSAWRVNVGLGGQRQIDTPKSIDVFCCSDSPCHHLLEQVGPSSMIQNVIQMF